MSAANVDDTGSRPAEGDPATRADQPGLGAHSRLEMVLQAMRRGLV